MQSSDSSLTKDNKVAIGSSSFIRANLDFRLKACATLRICSSSRREPYSLFSRKQRRRFGLVYHRHIERPGKTE